MRCDYIYDVSWLLFIIIALIQVVVVYIRVVVVVVVYIRVVVVVVVYIYVSWLYIYTCRGDV
jgi:hypothetical protein